MRYYNPMYKSCRTMFLKDNTHLTDIMKVISVCGEIGYFSIRLFGEVGNGKTIRYGTTREHLLGNREYKSSGGKTLYKGNAFTVRGKGQEKTIRVTSGGRTLFEEFEWGKEYLDKYADISLPTDRERVLRTVALSEWCIFMLRNGIEFNPKINPELFKSPSQPTSNPQNNNKWERHQIDKPIFYPGKEVKQRAPNNSFRGRGSRALGVLVKQDGTEICYQLPKTRMVWREKEEGMMGVFVTTKLGPQNFGINTRMKLPNALCLVDDYDKCEQVVFCPPYNKNERNKQEHGEADKISFKDMFSNVYVFPRNEGGVKSFSFHCIPDIEELLFDYYIGIKEYKKDTYRSGYDCDAYNYDNKDVILFFFDGNITRLHNCAKARQIYTMGGKKASSRILVFCFPWQRWYVEKVFAGAEGVEIVEQDYDFLSEEIRNKSKERS